MFKVKIDYEMLKKYEPFTLSVEQIIYSHYNAMANIKKLTEENQKMQEVFNKYKQMVETQQ
jgi:hypothetical protein